MYAALSAARAGAERVLLADKSLVGRGGATMMAQMTVAAALAEESADDWSSTRRYARGGPRPLRRAARRAAVRGRAGAHP